MAKLPTRNHSWIYVLVFLVHGGCYSTVSGGASYRGALGAGANVGVELGTVAGAEVGYLVHADDDNIHAFRGALKAGYPVLGTPGRGKTRVIPRVYLGIDRSGGGDKADTTYPLGLEFFVPMMSKRGTRGLTVTTRYVYHAGSRFDQRRHEFAVMLGGIFCVDKNSILCM